MTIIECPHLIIKWIAMPYDWNKGGAYYRAYCAICSKDLKQETYLPPRNMRLSTSVPNHLTYMMLIIRNLKLRSKLELSE